MSTILSQVRLESSLKTLLSLSTPMNLKISNNLLATRKQ